MPRYHGNEGTISHTGISTNTAGQLSRFTVNFEAAEMDGTEQGDSWSATDLGITSMTVEATMFLSDDEAPPVVGTSASLVLVHKATGGGGPGQFTGTFVITRVGIPYQLNNNVVVDVTLKNVGAVATQTVS